MLSYDDKRDFYRMMVNSEVTVTIIDDEADSTLLATCRDLSATGLAIEMSHPMELNTLVKVNIDSANNSVQSLNVTGKVVRVTEETDDSYLIGINISEID
ncbi:PilZ domain-containing protein [Thalassotalea piscium]|uniref:C-di-GMP-binding flagellar brake protein YcgR n=1 Tax=Thalassotalea piscium TaxID=1230533 RepID=A0A7X0TTL5_9GAMM|nr:PilZ domain-containing protein [Thalassotalea piscium]MBB6543210.1 c-di-GMP-binding flagellar brake protein YcgR [Thalassotalea piscium]